MSRTRFRTIVASLAAAAAIAALAGCGGGAGARPGGGAGGSAGGADGGQAGVEFPFPGRWWAHVNAPPVLWAEIVIHWSATDRSLWTQTHSHPLIVEADVENGFILRSDAGELGCLSVRATADPDQLEIRACMDPPSSGRPALGAFLRGAPLVREIPLPPVGTDEVPPFAGVRGFGGGGQWALFQVDAELWLWRNDTGELFDVGRGEIPAIPPAAVETPPPAGVGISPDGRRVAYRRPSAAGVPYSLVVYDTAAASEQILNDAFDGSVALFSPDGRWLLYYGNETLGVVGADLIAHDFDTGGEVTLAPAATPLPLTSSAWFTASGAHVLFSASSVAQPLFSAYAPVQSYDFATGGRRDFGDAREMIAAPYGSFVAFTTLDGQVWLLDDATWTARVVGNTKAQGDGSTYRDGGLAPSPDGKRLGFADAAGALDFYDVSTGATTSVADQAGCYAVTQSLPYSDPSRAVAAFFAADGRSIVHPVTTACAASNYVFALGRYDQITRQETTVTLDQHTHYVLAIGPQGEVVYSDNEGTMLLSWQAPSPSSALVPDGTTYLFTTDDRYLVAIGASYVVRDQQSGLTTQTVPLDIASAWINPATGIGITYVSFSSTTPTLTLYPPAGGSTMLALAAGLPHLSPTHAVLAYDSAPDAAGAATFVIPLASGATPRMIGNGKPLATSDKQVIFRDLDGICALSL